MCVFLLFDVFVAEQLKVPQVGPSNLLLLRTPARSFVENSLHRRDARGACQLLNRFAKKRNFLSRGPPGRPRALVVPALERMTWTPAEPLCGCARNAFSLCALNSSTKSTRVGREAPREIRGPTREKEGRYIANCCFRVFISSRRTRRIQLSS